MKHTLTYAEVIEACLKHVNVKTDGLVSDETENYHFTVTDGASKELDLDDLRIEFTVIQ